MITLLDVNDNHPLFVSSSFSAQISESSNIGTLVISLAATDLDFGTNAEVRYQIPVGSPNAGNFKFDYNVFSTCRQKQSNIYTVELG